VLPGISKDRVAFIFNVSMSIKNALEYSVATMGKVWPAFTSLDGQTLAYVRVFPPLKLMAFFMDLETLKMKAKRSSETSGATYRNSPLLRFGNLKTRINLRSLFPLKFHRHIAKP
jgi:hypothetical protein